jgi:DNA-binding SARP family transcriptional activator
LAYLAVTGKARSREFLASLLWEESTEANARANLRKSLAEIREKLGEYLLIEHQQIAFNQNSAYKLDIEDFQKALKKQSRMNFILQKPQNWQKH